MTCKHKDQIDRIMQDCHTRVMAVCNQCDCDEPVEPPPPPPPPPPPSGKYVRVQLGTNKILSPDGNPETFSVITWENPFEDKIPKITHQDIIRFMDYMIEIGGNCILLKANSWMVDDSGRNFLQHRFTGLKNLVQAAEARGIYVIINLFDTWARAKGTNTYTTDNNQHPINAWNKGHTEAAAEYVKKMAREFCPYPRVMFELGNEMEWGHHSQDYQTFVWMAKNHLLPHFYAIAGNDRPIGVSEGKLWQLPVNVVFNHNPLSMPFVNASDRPVITNELASGSGLWKHDAITNLANVNRYKAAVDKAKNHNHSGCAAATGLVIKHLPLQGSPEDKVLRYLSSIF